MIPPHTHHNTSSARAWKIIEPTNDEVLPGEELLRDDSINPQDFVAGFTETGMAHLAHICRVRAAKIEDEKLASSCSGKSGVLPLASSLEVTNLVKLRMLCASVLGRRGVQES